MRKWCAIMAIGLLCMTCAACGNTKTAEKDAGAKKQASQESNTGEENTGVEENNTAATEEKAEVSPSDTENTQKQLVVYFSATGNTKGIAEMIAGGTGADLYEIVAAEPYSEADLDYNDSNSRSTKEMNDTEARPEISGSIENFAQYDTVYIGYPIWWGEAPRIMDTFVEQYDFDGKTVIPFCTSASSGVGSSASRLEELAGGGDWEDGKRFSEQEGAATVMDWVNNG